MAKMNVAVTLDSGAAPFPAVNVVLPDADFARVVAAHAAIYGQVPVTPATTPPTYRDMTDGETALRMFQGWVNGALNNALRHEQEQAAKAAAASQTGLSAPTFTPAA